MKKTIIDIFGQSSKQFANKIAIKGKNYSYTYNEFENASKNFAENLLNLGCQHQDYIGICMERSFEMVLGIFGILHAGCAYVPSDPSNPAKRIENLYKSANIKYVVTTSNLKQFIEDMGFIAIVPVVNINSIQHDFNLYISPDDNAYVLFTSGSTGIPKGVIIAHHSVVNLCEYIQDRYPLNQGDIVLLKSPYTFDGSVWELFGWLLMGGTLYICEPGDEKNPAKLCEIIKKEQINFMFFVPSMLSVFLDYADTLKDKLTLSSLKWVSVGGEVLSPTLVTHFYKSINNNEVRLFNVYGPTETCVYATTYLCDPKKNYTKLPIGELVTNDYIYILDENLNQVSVGEEGEICIGGRGLAKGYLNLPEFTKEKFIADPIKGEGLIYRTGDIGRELPDGLYDFIGRKDFQVKLRGLRIEMGEIETALQHIDEVYECVVLFAKDRNDDDSLIAYLRTVSTDIYKDYNFRIADDEYVTFITSRLKETIPQYMIPSEFIICDMFPINQNGKIDRNALPSVKNFNLKISKKEFVPENKQQEIVYNCWKNILGKELIGENEDFFQAGGHSLKAIQLITEIIKNFGIEIPLSIFYDKLTITKMCKYISDNIDVKQTTQNNYDNLKTETNFYPITPVQKEMWIMNSFDSSGITHNIQIEFTIKELIDYDKLIYSIRKTIESEEIFRTSFPIHNQEPVQLINKNVDFEIPVTDLINNENKAEIYERIIYDNGHIIFDFNKLPLFSFHLIKWHDDEIKLLMSIHHIIFDGWSLSLFMKKIIQVYNDKPLNNNKYTNGDYAIWLNKQIENKSYQNDLDYWKKTLQNIPQRITLPLKPNADFSKSGLYGKRYWFAINKELSADIENFAIQNQTTTFVILLTAYQLALAKISGQKEIIVGTPFANRQHPMLSELIGYYTNMLSIPSKIDEKESFINLILKCNESAIRAFSHSMLPYGELVKQLNLKYEQGMYPIFQVIFVLQNWVHTFDSENILKITQREIGNETSKMDLLFNAEKVENEFICFIEYDTSLYNEQLTKDIASEIEISLNKIIYKPYDKIETLIKHENNNNNKSCIIIGEGSIAAHCTNILYKNNFKIKHIISNDDLLIEFANKNGILINETIANPELYPDVDFIFSINNANILKENFLQKARTFAINYHDSPLPKYAGMFATNHALLNNEKEHGISWHIIDNEIDAGDIIASAKVDITEDETAFTLNLKCYEAAIQAFENLIEEILSGNYKLIKQDRKLRTIFSLNKRPENYGIINWNQTADELENLKRSCYFGKNNDNEFLIPSIFVNNQFYYVIEYKCIKSKNTKPSLISIINNKIAVDCKNAYLVFDKLYDCNGLEINAEDIFIPDTYLENISESNKNEIDETFRKNARFEKYWVNQLYNADFFDNKINISDINEKYKKRKIPITNFNNISDLSGLNTDNFLESIISLYFIILSGSESGTIAYIDNKYNAYFSDWEPLNIKLNSKESINDSIKNISDKIAEIKAKGIFCNSLINRYKNLNDLRGKKPSVFIIKNNINHSYPIENNVFINISDNEIIIEGINKDIENSISFFIQNCLENLNSEISSIPLISEKTLLFKPKIQDSQTKENEIDIANKFAIICEEYPENIAIFDSGKEIKYKDFYDDVCRFSQFLINQGIRENEIVAIGIPRSYEYFLAMLAIINCGAAFLTIDGSLPSDRQKYILKDSEAVLLITEKENIDFNLKQINISKSDFRNTEIKPVNISYSNSLAYVIYTSGSTGKPKGVKISRKSLSGFINSAIELYKIKESDRVLQFSNLSFDASLEEIFCSFCSGAGLYLKTDEMLDLEEFINFSNKNKITIWDLPTAFWRQLINNKNYTSKINSLDLRLVIIGGEAVTKNDFTIWKSNNLNNHQLFNTYGPTETTIVALAYELNKLSDNLIDIPIGNPLKNVEIKIQNKFGQNLPKGVEGELIIIGDCVTEGYINSDLVQNSVLFIDENTKQKSYKTGDIVYADENELIFYKGRTDDQLKIRGFRIEPREIETKVINYEGVENAVVFAITESNGDKILASFYTCKTQIISETQIREHLNENIPKYMIPNIIQYIDKIPLTRNGKADKQKLSEIALQKLKLKSNDMIQPIGKTEKQIYEIWKSAFNRENISVTDDFFEIGGHSLIAVQVMGGIKMRLNTDLPLSALISNPSIRQLADLIESKSTKHLWDVIVPIRREGFKTPVFLIHGAGLNVLLYQSLSRNMKTDRPIYAVQAKGLDGEQTLNTSIEIMANHYIAEIKKVQPNGPYNLLGFSLGGFIAFEMASILLKNNEKAGFIGVIDSVTDITKHNRNLINKIAYKSYKLIMKPLFIFYLFLKEPYEEKKTFIKNKYENLQLTLKYYLKKSKIGSFELKQIEGDTPVYLDKNLKFRLMAALQNYVLTEQEIELHLFKAEKSTFFVLDKIAYGWKKYAKKGVKVHQIPGDHTHIFAPPNDKLFAEKLDEQLNRCDN